METRPNHWELYSSMRGWEAVSERLDAALASAIEKLDAAVVSGDAVRVAVVAAFNEVQGVMGIKENAEFGARDSEPYYHLSRALTKHIRTRWSVGEARIDRFGDPEGFDAPRFGHR